MYKVMRIVTRLCVGGPTIHVSLLNGLLDKKEYESILVSGMIEDYESDMSYVADSYNVKPVYIETMSRELNLVKDLKAFSKLIKLIKKEKPDIVHTHLSKAAMLGRVAAWLCKVPVIIHTYHGNVFQCYFSKPKTMMYILIDKFLAALSTKIIAISNKQKSELVGFGIANASKFEIIPLGFDFDKIVTSDAKRTELVKKYCLPENAKFASIIGRVTPIKNHDMFLDIAKKLITKHDDLYFLVVGDGDLFEEVKTKISARKLGDKIIMTGMIQDMSTIYSLTDIVLLTSKNEGTPVALIEAMSQSKLVFSTNVGGVSDFIKQGINGFYFEQSDVDGFVSEISNWVTNPHNYDNIREGARTTAVNTFSSTRLVSDIESLYSRCLNK